jgi:hypothetical protein
VARLIEFGAKTHGNREVVGTSMDEIELLIARFRGEDTPKLAKPDKSIKPGVIESLEEHAADPRALDFLLHVAADRQEFDLARIEALKVLELREPGSDEERRRIAPVLKDVLVGDPDDDVRQYAAMAAAYYMSESDLVDAVAQRAFDQGEDIDLRWNAFAALKQLGPTPRGIELLRAASEDAVFRNSALLVLKKWGVG